MNRLLLITLTDSEGPTRVVEALRGRTFRSFADFDAAVAPLRNGYCTKVWFQILDMVSMDVYDGRYDMLAPERTWQKMHRGGLRAWVVGFQSAMLADRFADIVRAGYGDLEEARATARMWLGRFGATDEEVARG